MLGKGTPLQSQKAQKLRSPKSSKSLGLSYFYRSPHPTQTPTNAKHEAKERNKSNLMLIDLLIDFPFRISDKMTKGVCPFNLSLTILLGCPQHLVRAFTAPDHASSDVQRFATLCRASIAEYTTPSAVTIYFIYI